MTTVSAQPAMLRTRMVMLAMLGVLVAPPAARASFVTFESGQVRPLALSPDGARLFAVNTPDDRLEIFDVGPAGLVHRESVPVGLEPVAVAVRNAGEVWVVNHLSDSVSIVDVGATPPRVVRTLLVGDEPRDIVFAGPGAAPAPSSRPRTAARTDPVDPRARPRRASAAPTSGCSTRRTWAARSAATPLTIVELFGDTPRALAASPDGGTVYAAVFHSGQPDHHAVRGRGLQRRRSAAAPCVVGGTTVIRAGCPRPTSTSQGNAAPEVGLIVRLDHGQRHWEDELGRDWDAGVRFILPDLDVFAHRRQRRHAGRDRQLRPRRHRALQHGRQPGERKGLRLATPRPATSCASRAPACSRQHSVRGHLHEARITVLDGANVAAAPPQQAHRLRRGCRPPASGEGDAASRRRSAMAVTATADALRRGVRLEPGRRLQHRRSSRPTPSCPTASNHIAVSGGGPSGLVLDESRGRLYVLTRFDDAISVIDTATGGEIAHQPLYNPEPASGANGPAVALRRGADVEQRRGVVRELPHLRRLRQPGLGPRQPR